MTRSRAEEQMILLSAGTAVRRRALREQARGLMVDVDWSRLAEMLRDRRLLPTLGPRVLELADGYVNCSFAVAVKQAMEAGRRQGVFLQLITMRVTAALADAGIRSAALKGPLLGEAIYHDPGRRASGDIDLIVDPDQLRAAVEVVRGLGYGPPMDHVEYGGLPLLHFALVHERGELPPVELHWRIHWYERSFARERLLPPAVDPTNGWRPAPADELAALLLFYARDGFIDLRLATDVSAWWDTFGASLPRGALDELLSVYPALAHVIPVAAKVAENVVGLPTTQVISAMRKLRVRDRVAVRLANPHPHTSQPQLYADMGLIDGLLMPRGSLRAFIKRHLMPPQAVLDERARRTPERRRTSPLGHSVRVLGRYGLAMCRVIYTSKTLHLP
jgi:hypothetical protein